MKRILPVLVLVLAVGGFLFWKFRPVDDDNVLRLSGNIEFRKLDVAFKTAGRLAELTVDEGMDVKTGQLLARLDPEQILRVRERDTASIDAAQSGLLQLRQTIEYQKAALESELALREAEVRQAKSKLLELTQGARPQEIAQARAQVADLRGMKEQAQRDLARAEKLIAAEDISQSQFDQFRLRLSSTTAQLENAEQRLSQIVEGPRQTDLETARAQVARAEAALNLTASQRLEIAHKQEDLNVRRAEIERSKANVRVIESQIDDTSVASPVDGVVLIKSANRGEILAAGTPVLTVGEIDKPWFRGYVPQTLLGRVRLGMPVEVSSDSYPGKIYPGRISFISSEAEFTPKQIQTQEERVKLVYRIKVEVENPRRELKLNMPVDALVRLQ